MKQRRVVITGANSGIGLAASRQFLEEGHRVVMACRNMDSGRKARDDISSGGYSDVELMELDCASAASIHAFASSYRQKFGELDILINNAAYFNHGSPRMLNRDGIELTFATNVVAPWLLTRLLLEPLSQSRDPRVLNAGSNIVKHFFNPKKRIDLEHVTGELPDGMSFSVYNRYRDSKMALLMLTFRMSEEYASSGISVNMLQINGAKMSPETLRKVTPGYRMIARVQNLFFPPPEFMAGCYYKLTTSNDFQGVSGKLFNHRLEVMKPALEDSGAFEQIRQIAGADRYPVYADDREETDRIWRMCERLTEKTDESKTGN